MRTLRGSMLIGLCLALLGCDGSRHTSGKVISRVLSPNGRTEALITRSSGGGATVSSVFRIYLKPTTDDLNYEILTADKVSPDPKVAWSDDNHLIVELQCGQIDPYRNSLDVMKQGNLAYQVSIKLENNGLCSVYPTP